MQILDSLIDGALALEDKEEGNAILGMIIRYLRNGEEPEPESDVQEMAIAMVWPVLEKSRNRVVSGSKGGSKPASKTVSKQGSKQVSKTVSKSTSKQVSKPASKTVSKQGSDIYSSSSSYIPKSLEIEGECEGEEENIPYSKIIDHLNEKCDTSYRDTSRKTRGLIHARFAEGFTIDDFFQVIDTMSDAWGGDTKMCAYLRPETLFGTKFESYLNRPHTKKGDDDFAAYD